MLSFFQWFIAAIFLILGLVGLGSISIFACIIAIAIAIFVAPPSHKRIKPIIESYTNTVLDRKNTIIFFLAFVVIWFFSLALPSPSQKTIQESSSETAQPSETTQPSEITQPDVSQQTQVTPSPTSVPSENPDLAKPSIEETANNPDAVESPENLEELEELRSIAQEIREIVAQGEIMAQAVQNGDVLGCTEIMRDVKPRAEALREQAQQLDEILDNQESMFVAIAATRAVTCVDCLGDNSVQCNLTLDELNQAGF